MLAHAGQHWMPDADEVVGKNPNVWADISGGSSAGTEGRPRPATAAGEDGR